MTEETTSNDDGILWAAIRQDDERAFAALYDRYWAIIYKNAFHYLKDKESCMDIVNDIFIGIWYKRHDLAIVSFKHYLTKATRYKVYDKIESNSKNKIVDLAEWKENKGNAVSNEFQGKIVNQELEQKIDNLLESLPKRCREIFILSRRQNLSNSEIADKLDISKRTVENQLTHALQHLRASLGDITLGFMVFCVFNK